jgi:NADH-ubiquinone oxidoreductase chain 6
MNSLFVFIESYTNGYRDEVLNILSLIATLCGILVIISKNPIVSVLYLIGLFLSISCYLILLGLNFIGLSYLLVYIGAVSILFLFILMLINVRVSELLNDTSKSIPLAVIICISISYTVNQILPYYNYNSPMDMNNLIHVYTDYLKNFSSLDYTNDNNPKISFVTSNI